MPAGPGIVVALFALVAPSAAAADDTGVLDTGVFDTGVDTDDTVNDPPVITASGPIAVIEGDHVTVGPLDLHAEDPDDAPSALKWTLDKAPEYGVLEVGGVAVAQGAAFTQQDVDDALLDYVHDGSEKEQDGFELTMSDAAGEPASTTVLVVVSPVDDPPVLVTNGVLDVAEGLTAAVSKDFLRADDVDTQADAVTFTVDVAPSVGLLTLDGDPLGAGDAFSMVDVTLGLVVYAHDGSETTEDAFEFTLSDGTSSLSDKFAIAIAPVNERPTVDANTGLDVAEGGEVALDGLALSATDNEDGPSELTWTLATGPTHGDLWLGATLISVHDTFSQTLLDLGLVAYVHDGSETTSDVFDLVLTDSGGLGEQVVIPVAVTPSNDPPALAASGSLTVDEGGTVGLGAATLSLVDPDDGPTTLRFQLVAPPASGQLRIQGVAAAAGQVFTQADVNLGNVAYVHDASESTSDALQFTTADVGGAAGPGVTVPVAVQPVDDPPALATNTGTTVDEGDSVRLDEQVLFGSDADTTAADRVFTVTSGPDHGTILVGGDPATAFTQADLDGGEVQYVHDGSETDADAFGFVLADATTNLPEATFAIGVDPVDDPPRVVRNAGIAVPEGGFGAIDDAVLRAVDPDDGPADLDYRLLDVPAFGVLTLGGAALAPDDAFTQSDLADGLVAYEHDGGDATSDRFVFVVTDPSNEAAPAEAFEITVGAGDDAPVLVVSGPLEVVEGGSALVGPETLWAEDPDDSPSRLVYTLVTSPTSGVVRRFGAPLGAGSTFTQADVDGLVVSYTHNGGDAPADALVVALTDGSTLIGPETLAIDVAPQGDAGVAVDDGPYHLDQDGVLTVDALAGILVNDLEGDGGPLAVRVDHGVVNGTLDLSPDGSFVYTPDVGFTGADRFTYIASDGVLDSNTASAILLVDPLPDEPDTDTGEDPDDCGCAVAAGPGSAPLALLVGVLVRRRRRS